MLIRECKYCKSEDLYIQAKNYGDDALTTELASVKCAECGKWLGWCPKKYRHLFRVVEAEMPAELEEMEPEVKTLKSAMNNAILDAKRQIKSKVVLSTEQVYTMLDNLGAVLRRYNDKGQFIELGRKPETKTDTEADKE